MTMVLGKNTGTGYVQKNPSVLCLSSLGDRHFRDFLRQRLHQVKTKLATSKEIQSEYKIKITGIQEKLESLFPSHQCNCCCPLFTYICKDKIEKENYWSTSNCFLPLT